MHVALSAANIPAATRRATPNLRLRDPVASRGCVPRFRNRQRRLRPGNVVDRVRCPYPRAPVESLAPTLTPSLADTLPPQALPVPPSSAPRRVACPPRPSAPTPPPCSSTSTALWVTHRTPPCIVAFWELAPYLPDADNLTIATRDTSAITRVRRLSSWWTWWRRTAKQRASLRRETRASAAEDPAVLAHVNAARKNPDSPSRGHPRAREGHSHLQKDETVDALSLAHPCPGVPDVLARLAELKVPFSIATTSGKHACPSPWCPTTDYFPPEAIHSGESDFTPPRFKPDPTCTCSRRNPPAPSRKTASPWRIHVGRRIGGECEDQSHRRVRRRVAHLGERRGARRDAHGGRTIGHGRGADVVVSDMKDLVPIVSVVQGTRRETRAGHVPQVAHRVARVEDLRGPNAGRMKRRGGARGGSIGVVAMLLTGICTILKVTFLRMCFSPHGNLVSGNSCHPR